MLLSTSIFMLQGLLGLSFYLTFTAAGLLIGSIADRGGINDGNWRYDLPSTITLIISFIITVYLLIYLHILLPSIVTIVTMYFVIIFLYLHMREKYVNNLYNLEN